MSSNINDLILHLTSRLPELELQLQKLGDLFPARSLSPGIFRVTGFAKACAYIHEIKDDLKRLSEPNSDATQAFLAHLVNQKINVLVRLCKKKPGQADHLPDQSPLLMDRICTRRQRLDDLELLIHELTQQQEALLKTAKQALIQPAVQLTLQQEIGALQRRLTLAEEAYKTLTH